MEATKLRKKKKSELLVIAQQMGVDANGNLTKDVIISRINSAEKRRIVTLDENIHISTQFQGEA